MDDFENYLHATYAQAYLIGTKNQVANDRDRGMSEKNV